MPRVAPPDRFARLIEAGTSVFVAQGFERTQMQDVADALGVSKGTLYASVTGKDALFEACVRYADGLEPLPTQDLLPVPASGTAALVDTLALRLAGAAELGLRRRKQALEPVVRELVARLARHRCAIKLVDRCAPEIPELAGLWYGEGRAQLVTDLAGYLRRHVPAERLASPHAALVASRTIVESCVFWAVHRHFDPAPAQYSDPISDEDAVEALVAVLLKGLAP